MAEMTSKERVMKMLNWEIPDRVPLIDGFWNEWTVKWRAEKGLSDDVSPNEYYLIDNYIAVGDETPYPSLAAELKREGGYIYKRDGWGQTIRVREQDSFFYEQLDFAYDDKGNLVYGDFEPAALPERYAAYDSCMEALKQRYCVFVKTGGPFIRTYFMRGEVPFLMDMAADPKMAQEMVMRTAHHLAAIGVEQMRRWGLHDTGVWIFDDMAAAKGPMFSPRSAEQILAPAWSYMVKRFREAGAHKVILHSDGNIGPLMDLLIDCGFDGFNPVEYRAGLDVVKLREKYGKRTCFLGGLDNVHILTQGTPEEVRQHTLHVLSAGVEGGLALGCHSIGPDIPVANWDAVFETWQQYGTYPMNLPQ